MKSGYYTFKQRVVVLRRNGKTYGEIRKIIGRPIPKSTLSYWCRNVSLPQRYYAKVKLLSQRNASKGRRVALIVNKLKREEYLASLIKRNKHLIRLLRNRDIAKIALAMLYLGEGAKWKYYRGLLLGSSDPDIVKIYIKLLQKCYDVSKEDMRARILYRADQNLNSLETFWSRITGIPRHHFYNTNPDPRTIGKKTQKKDYHGVCVITCRGTEIQLELDIVAKMFLDI